MVYTIIVGENFMKKFIEYSNSSNIDKTSYDEEKKTMYIKFKSGGSYTYEGVPLEIYNGMQTSPSAGRYFHAVIKKNYPYKKVESI